MSAEPQLFRINPESRESERIEEVNFAQLGLQERRDIQEWIAANPGILGEGFADNREGVQRFRQDG